MKVETFRLYKPEGAFNLGYSVVCPLLRQPFREPEITNLRIKLLGKQNVSGFNVSVDDSPLTTFVKIIKALGAA